MKYIIGLISAGIAALIFKNTTMRESPNVGETAPAFVLADATGIKHQLADYRGQWVVLYFYPKDDTPGCTKEACFFRDTHSQFEKLNTTVIGISLDNADSHDLFKQKYKLPFTLLSDPNGEVAAAYGALMHLGVTKIAKRYTFLIDPEGRVAKRYQAVDPSKHADELLADLNQLMPKLIE